MHDLIWQRIDQRNFAALERIGTVADEETPAKLYARVRIAIEAERARVLEIRSGGTVASGGNSHRGEECADLEQYPPTETQSEPVCDACLREGMRWVAMRQCLVCGNVACCDSSLGQHATAHFHETGHPVMESAEPGEDWRWCFVHHRTA